VVDIELLLVALLQADDEIAGGVWVDLPEHVDRPCVRVQAGGGREDTSDYQPWLNRPTVNIEAWGETRQSASAAIHVVRDRMLRLPREDSVQTHGEVARVTATYPFYVADPDFPVDDRPGPRYTFTARLTVHPVRA
jgi:hypothetical protein